MAPRPTNIVTLAAAIATSALGAGCSGFGLSKSGATGTTPLAASAPAPSTFRAKVASLFSRDSQPTSSSSLRGPANPTRRTIDPTEDAALAVSSKPKTGPDLNVAMAKLYEKNNNVAEAEAQYKKALQADDKYLPALEGLARLEDRQQHYDVAIGWYIKAIEAAPSEGRLYNDLGLCLHRDNMLPESIKALRKAIDLQPDKSLYHNNLAAVLLEADEPQKALDELIAAAGPANGHYNMGYLLWRRNKKAESLDQFKMAASLDPSLDAARQWVARLEGTSAAAGLAGSGAESAPVAPATGANAQAGVLVAQKPNPAPASSPIARRQAPSAAPAGANVSAAPTSAAPQPTAALQTIAAPQSVAEIGVPEPAPADSSIPSESGSTPPAEAVPAETAAASASPPAPAPTPATSVSSPAANDVAATADAPLPGDAKAPPPSGANVSSATDATAAAAPSGASPAATGSGPSAPASSGATSTAAPAVASSSTSSSGSAWTPYDGPPAQVDGDPTVTSVSNASQPTGQSPTPALGASPPASNADASGGPTLPSARRAWFQRSRS